MAARSSSFGTAGQPPMLTKLFIAIGLVALCVAIHAIHAMGLIAVLRWLKGRLVGGVEAVAGILMCGLSTGMFFAVFSETFGLRSHPAPDS